MEDNLDYFVDTGCNLLCDENYKANSAVLVIDYSNGCETDYPTETGIDTFFTDTNFRRDGIAVEELTGRKDPNNHFHPVIECSTTYWLWNRKEQGFHHSASSDDGCGTTDTTFFVSNYAVIDADDGTNDGAGTDSNDAGGSTVTVTQTTTVTVKSGGLSSFGSI
ncbi:hypothetical protein HDU76_000443, partial [Blyttiomyces sp. JEL0837]